MVSYGEEHRWARRVRISPSESSTSASYSNPTKEGKADTWVKADTCLCRVKADTCLCAAVVKRSWFRSGEWCRVKAETCLCAAVVKGSWFRSGEGCKVKAETCLCAAVVKGSWRLGG